MKQHIFENVKTDASGRWVSIHEMDHVTQLIINDVINLIETNHTINHCAGTTYDLTMVECTKSRIVDLLKEEFEIKAGFLND